MSADGGTGRSAPVGATPAPGGVNFSLYSRHATAVDLCFFERVDDARPAAVLQLNPATRRTRDFWHTFVPGIEPGQLYGYRVAGPFAPERGLRFDGTKLLLDPYGRGVAVPLEYNRQAARLKGDRCEAAMKSVVVDPSTYDWEGDAPPRTPAARTIVYEMHVRGFTRHPSSGVAEVTRGTYRGSARRFRTSRRSASPRSSSCRSSSSTPRTRRPGWSTTGATHRCPSSPPTRGTAPGRIRSGPIDEFRDMVKALHRAGIEVILDVVFNHTAEGDHEGPTLSLRGIDNPTYYILKDDPSRYANYTGTGNTLNANQPIVRRMVLDSLRYWVQEMHVDGFRFDLAAVLSRDSGGRPMPSPPVLADIESDPVLAGTKLMAEAWDAAGLYQVGNFGGDGWKEWNGKFRDDVRDFFRAAPRSAVRMADRLFGSPEMYAHKQREAEQSVNFVTCHDGFTLNDLVSYEHKHNEANREDNRDGTEDNRSWNWGVEGPTADPEIESLRRRQVKNFLTATVLSVGLPMLLMGDEVRRTQRGNNNAYCHDDETSWFDWTLLEKHADLRRFVSMLNQRWPTRGRGAFL